MEGGGHLGASVAEGGSGGMGRGGHSSQQVSRKCPEYDRSLVVLVSLFRRPFSCFESMEVVWWDGT